MSTSRADAIAEAVKDELNAPDFFWDAGLLDWSISFTATRRPMVRRDLGDTDSGDLVVSVIARSEARERDFRRGHKHEHTIGIVVQKGGLNFDSNTEIDPYKLLAEEIGDYFENHSGEAFAGAYLVSQELTPLFDPERAVERRQFEAVINLNFRQERSEDE